MRNLSSRKRAPICYCFCGVFFSSFFFFLSFFLLLFFVFLTVKRDVSVFHGKRRKGNMKYSAAQAEGKSSAFGQQ